MRGALPSARREERELASFLFFLGAIVTGDVCRRLVLVFVVGREEKKDPNSRVGVFVNF